MIFSHAMMLKSGSALFLPTGIILPLYGGGAVPADWTLFTAANARFIVGAGGTTAVGGTGGTGAITPTANTAGSHTGALGSVVIGGQWHADANNAAHSHSWSAITPGSPYSSFRLIHADLDMLSIPQNVGVFKHTTAGFPGMTRYVPTSMTRLLKADTAQSEGATLTSLTTGATSNAHRHGSHLSGVKGAAGNMNPKHVASGLYGAHGHTKTFTWTYDTYQVLLNLWYFAASSGKIPSGAIIGMYDNVTPPDGWSLCNGSGGTPDMRNRFAAMPVADSAGASGSNYVSAATGDSSSDGGHAHSDGTVTGYAGLGQRYHVLTAGAHQHTLTAISQIWLPSYYGLAFIMYTG